jgi:hypothetical protein
MTFQSPPRCSRGEGRRSRIAGHRRGHRSIACFLERRKYVTHIRTLDVWKDNQVVHLKLISAEVPRASVVIRKLPNICRTKAPRFFVPKNLSHFQMCGDKYPTCPIGRRHFDLKRV